MRRSTPRSTSQPAISYHRSSATPHHRSSATPTPDLVSLGLPSSSSGTATPYHSSGVTAPTTDLAPPTPNLVCHPFRTVPLHPMLARFALPDARAFASAVKKGKTCLTPECLDARCRPIAMAVFRRCSTVRCGCQPTQFKTAAGIVKRL
ncbi:hypothetical protein GUJ93_ZPchr0013g34659 [Zizania palustris]|uniref:Uncharacterized protein n=1 Tax=Zizania palustris TaxID=103762 RepID=A0A8J5X338_ZIZPA|nr:hypothetical protein GUJ93_ZPchr0013g34659 [Zizania palustris]